MTVYRPHSFKHFVQTFSMFSNLTTITMKNALSETFRTYSHTLLKKHWFTAAKYFVIHKKLSPVHCMCQNQRCCYNNYSLLNPLDVMIDHTMVATWLIPFIDRLVKDVILPLLCVDSGECAVWLARA